MRTVIRSPLTAFLWEIAIPLVSIWAGTRLALPGWAILAMAMLTVAGVAVLKPPMWVALAERKVGDSHDGRHLHEIDIVVSRWFKVRRYGIDDLEWISVNEFRVSVPLTYLEFADGQHVGPLLTGEDSVRFVKRLIVELGLAGRQRDGSFWDNIGALERYFRQSSQ